ncbi:uncharacterized protein LOC106061374 isoform X2 [Biomphalaria glabrata]|uniref:Uncharacterized protein LOC106061374 isoform X2 n=1 Tax=Biomphalaria glabrata TaxID=6526 RepID=A0A9W3A7K7_BIOGL|nr:uncharacterized protein LOC106061374 isoform X2 [Biomphalaria glabrata]
MSSQPNDSLQAKDKQTTPDLENSYLSDISEVNTGRSNSQESTIQSTSRNHLEDDYDLIQEIKDLDFGFYEPLDGNLSERLYQMKQELLQLQELEKKESSKIGFSQDVEQSPHDTGNRSDVRPTKRGRPIKEYKMESESEERPEPKSYLSVDSFHPAEEQSLPPNQATDVRRVSFQNLTLEESPRLDNYSAASPKLSPVNMSEGLRKYRRRSQMMIPSDIPSEIPLKNRHFEIKDTFNCIKRRLSEHQLQQEEQASHMNRKVSSSPGIYQDDIVQTKVTESNYSLSLNYKKGNAERSSRDSLLMTPPQHSYSRMSSQESEGGVVINFDRGLSEEEMDEYLGIIPAHQRESGMSPIPKVTPSAPRMSGFRRSQSLPSSSHFQEMYSDLSGADSDESLPSYVPIKKQKKNLKQGVDTRTTSKQVVDLDFYELANYGSSKKALSASLTSLIDSHLAAHIRKDSIALFNVKHGGIGQKLRRLSQVSIAELEQMRLKHMEMTKEELIKTYRLHVFVFLIFVVMVISLSLSWYYKQIANDILLANQNIFFDPATRTLTVLDPGHILKVTAKLGLEIPSWMLPLHCPLVVKDNPKIKQCIWKNRAKLTIQNVARSDVNCYNVSWESLQMQGVINSTFVKDSGGVVPGLTLYDGQLTAILDVFNQQSVTWFTERLKELNDIGIENFRLTYGTQSWLPYKPRFQSTTGTPNLYRKLMTEAVSRVSKTLIVEHSSESRHVNSLVPLVAKIDLVDGRNCIVGVIDEALTLSIMGYPLVMVDGFKEMKGAKMTSEMYLRWYQLALTFPAYLITKPPWSVNKSLVHAVKQLSPKENILGDYLHQLTEEVLKGQPILRPVWWQDPNNASVHAMAIQDQFLIGEMFLIAPILCEGRYQRDVYIPPGIWESEDRIILGPKVLTDFPVPLDKIVIFKQRKEK